MRFFYIACILLAAALLFAPLLIIAIAKSSAAGVLPGAEVSVKSCSLWPPGSCTLSGIEIERSGMYHISIPKIPARFNLIGDIRVSGVVLEARTVDARLHATGSFLLRAAKKEIRGISLQVSALESPGVSVTNAFLEAAVGQPGLFTVEKLNAGKLVVSDMRAAAALDNNTICLEDLSARVFGGSIKGSACVTLGAGVPYRAAIYLSDLDMTVFISDFRLAERVELSGAVEGAVTVKGAAAGYELLSGDLKAAPPGGVLNIRDQAMIDLISQRSGQARELISRSFTDYRYDQAHARLYTEENKLVLDVAFQGVGGKRALKVILHDFTVQGGGS